MPAPHPPEFRQRAVELALSLPEISSALVEADVPGVAARLQLLVLAFAGLVSAAA